MTLIRMKRLPKKIWIPAVVVIAIGFYLFIYNRPIELRQASLMSTPLIFRGGAAEPFKYLPNNASPPEIDIFYATDRKPSALSLLYPFFYGNERDMKLHLGKATVRFGEEPMTWEILKQESLKEERTSDIKMEISNIKELHEIGSASTSIKASLGDGQIAENPFIKAIQGQMDQSKTKNIILFVPGFKVDFTYPVLVAAELWHYLGYRGAFIAYSWPSRQRLLNYLTDVETTAFTAQHFRMLLLYLAVNTSVEKIHIVSYSAGARIVSQALHELRLMANFLPVSEIKTLLKIDQVIFAAPDIDLMLFAMRYRDGFEDIAVNISIYTNANDTALNWALRFFGWPRLGAPGEMGITPEELQLFKFSEKTTVIDVAAAENTASGNGHGYFVKSPWVSTDLLLLLDNKAAPQKRGLIQNADTSVWAFPDSYPIEIENLSGIK